MITQLIKFSLVVCLLVFTGCKPEGSQDTNGDLTEGNQTAKDGESGLENNGSGTSNDGENEGDGGNQNNETPIVNVNPEKSVIDGNPTDPENTNTSQLSNCSSAPTKDSLATFYFNCEENAFALEYGDYYQVCDHTTFLYTQIQAFTSQSEASYAQLAAMVNAYDFLSIDKDNCLGEIHNEIPVPATADCYSSNLYDNVVWYHSCSQEHYVFDDGNGNEFTCDNSTNLYTVLSAHEENVNDALQLYSDINNLLAIDSDNCLGDMHNQSWTDYSGGGSVGISCYLAVDNNWYASIDPLNGGSVWNNLTGETYYVEWGMQSDAINNFDWCNDSNLDINTAFNAVMGYRSSSANYGSCDIYITDYLDVYNGGGVSYSDYSYSESSETHDIYAQLDESTVDLNNFVCSSYESFVIGYINYNFYAIDGVSNAYFYTTYMGNPYYLQVMDSNWNVLQYFEDEASINAELSNRVYIDDPQ